MSRPVGTGESVAGSMLTTDHGCQGLRTDQGISEPYQPPADSGR